MAFVVTQRTREVGIRLALGASKSDVLRLLVQQGMLPVIGGAGCGLVLSAAVSGVLHAVLVSPGIDRKSTRLNSSHGYISYAVFCLKKKNESQYYDFVLLIVH